MKKREKNSNPKKAIHKRAKKLTPRVKGDQDPTGGRLVIDDARERGRWSAMPIFKTRRERGDWEGKNTYAKGRKSSSRQKTLRGVGEKPGTPPSEKDLSWRLGSERKERMRVSKENRE